MPEQFQPFRGAAQTVEKSANGEAAHPVTVYATRSQGSLKERLVERLKRTDDPLFMSADHFRQVSGKVSLAPKKPPVTGAVSVVIERDLVQVQQDNLTTVLKIEWPRVEAVRAQALRSLDTQTLKTLVEQASAAKGQSTFFWTGSRWTLRLNSALIPLMKDAVIRRSPWGPSQADHRAVALR